MLGLASFPGISQLVRASFTLSHGITPSVATLVIAPQAGFPALGGTLTFTFGNVRLAFPDCRIDTASYHRDAQGLTWSLAVLDRRWKWAFGHVSGRYNQLRADGTIEPATEKSPRELARLCLEAMGEHHVDVERLPDAPRPEIAWDYDNPAAALDALCHMLGCRVVLSLDNRVSLAPQGVGVDLPAGAITDDSGTIDPPERPDALLLVGGPLRFQAQLALEAVGIETDGSLMPIDELSYRPSQGWGTLAVDADDWQEIADEKARRLARRSVYRYYGISGHRDGTLQLPGTTEPLESLAQILPLENERIEATEDSLDGRQRSLKPRVLGEWYRFELDGANIVSKPGEEYARPFTLDRGRGLVMFDRPVVLERTASDATSSGQSTSEVRWKPARIFLETAFGVRDRASGAWRRYTRERRLGGQSFGTAPQIVRQDALVYTHIARYRDGRFSGVTTNDEPLAEFAEACLDAVAGQYEATSAREVRYAGLVAISPDGAIQQVTWEVAQGRGATTRASLNSEHHLALPEYHERRGLAQLAAIAQVREATREPHQERARRRQA